MSTAYVINMDKNPERWQAIQRAWKGAFALERVPAIQASPGWKGCALSHLKCIREAKERGDSNVLVWEDDCIPRIQSSGEATHPRILARLWKDAMEKLKSSDKWDIVIGATSTLRKGAMIDQELSSPSIKLYRLEHGFTTHWTLYNHTVYDRMLAWDEKEPIDVFMYKHAKIYVTLPFLAEQREGWSDIENRMTDYHSFFDTAEASLRSIANGNLLINQKGYKVIP